MQNPQSQQLQEKLKLLQQRYDILYMLRIEAGLNYRGWGKKYQLLPGAGKFKGGWKYYSRTRTYKINHKQSITYLK